MPRQRQHQDPGIRDAVQLTSAFPMQRPVPVTGEVSQMFRDALAAREVGLPGPFSIARRLIEQWYGGPLPVRDEVRGSVRD